jgi:diadenylate cyclase
MKELSYWFSRYFQTFNVTDIFDILVVGFSIYFLLRLVQGTRAVQLIKGFVVLIFVVLITGADLLNLKTTNWLLSIILQNWVIALIILFQPELRMVVEQIGRGKIFHDTLRINHAPDAVGMINEIVRAARRLSEKRVGMLIAVEREVGLNDIISTGRRINGAVSSEFVQTIFHPGTPMHDGGLVIQNQTAAAAMCLFPLSNKEDRVHNHGTRHRAAIGLSELTDAVIIVVSEETGIISIAVEGELISNLSAEGLKEKLLVYLQPKDQDNGLWFWKKEGKNKVKNEEVTKNE